MTDIGVKVKVKEALELLRQVRNNVPKEVLREIVTELCVEEPNYLDALFSVGNGAVEALASVQDKRQSRSER